MVQAIIISQHLLSNDLQDIIGRAKRVDIAAGFGGNAIYYRCAVNDHPRENASRNSRYELYDVLIEDLSVVKTLPMPFTGQESHLCCMWGGVGSFTVGLSLQLSLSQVRYCAPRVCDVVVIA